MPAPRDFALLRETYGIRLLAYLCASDEAAIEAWLEDGAHGPARLAPPLEAVAIGVLLPLARRASSEPKAWPGMGLEDLVMPVGDGSQCLGSALRVRSGGELYVEPSDGSDPVGSTLVRMAVDAYPLLMALGSGYLNGAMFSLYRHPVRDELLKAIQVDPSLGRLYVQDQPGVGRRGYLVDSFGRGRTTQDVAFAEEVILSSWDMVRMAAENPQVGDLVQAVRMNLERVREAVHGGSPPVPVRLVFTGFKVPEGITIPTPWGVLRPIREWERSFTPEPLRRSLSGQDDDGQEVLVSYGGEMVLEMELPYQLEVSDSPDTSMLDEHEYMSAVARLSPSPSLDRVKDAFALALAMAIERPPGDWVVSRLAWTWAADPLGRGHNIRGWGDTQRGPGFMPCVLSLENCAAVERWCEIVDMQWTGNLDVAVRRLLSASDARLTASDRLVDAVIVWEALFGTRQGESALRISAAMAWLLGDADLQARKNLRAEVNRIYNERSSIVHGRAHDEAALRGSSNQALQLAREALKRLMDERPDLLAVKDNAERSAVLLLGG